MRRRHMSRDLLRNSKGVDLAAAASSSKTMRGLPVHPSDLEGILLVIFFVRVGVMLLVIFFLSVVLIVLVILVETSAP